MSRDRHCRKGALQLKKQEFQRPSPTKSSAFAIRNRLRKTNISKERAHYVQTLGLTNMTYRLVPKEIWQILKAERVVSKSTLFRPTETALPKDDVYDRKYDRSWCLVQDCCSLNGLSRTQLTNRVALYVHCNQLPYMA